MKKVFYLTILLAGVMVLAFMPGCGAFQFMTGDIDKASICDTVPEGESAICALASKMGVKVEVISKGIEVANGIAVVKGTYKASEALEFLNGVKKEVEDYKESDFTYTLEDALNYAQRKWQLLSPEVQLLISIINPVDLQDYGVTLNLKPIDYDLILAGLDEQIDLVRPFVVFE